MTAAGGQQAATPALTELHEFVSLACRAPSMYNTQPWAWRAEHGRLDLYADRSRSLPAADPQDRNLTISCGAALDHLRVVAASLGWSTVVTRFPDPGQPDLLATTTFEPAEVTGEHARMFEALRLRRTDRRRFTSWPVPPERLDTLARVVSSPGVRVAAVHDEGARHTVERLVSRALECQASVDAIIEERQAWLDRSRDDGVPASTVPRLLGLPTSYRSRFGAGLLPQPERELETEDGVVIIGGPHDDPVSWLAAGEALSTLWLHAVDTGLSVLPLSQVVEVGETRNALRDEVLGGVMLPFLLARIGWQAAVPELPAHTPRRPLADVLLP